MESYPKFHNEVGVPIVRIGCREFKCIGDKPPQDHPHIYLKMGDASEIVCPYCSTLFRFDPSLGAHEADPADCAYGEPPLVCTANPVRTCLNLFTVRPRSASQLHHQSYPAERIGSWL